MPSWLMGIVAGLLVVELLERTYHRFKAANSRINADVEELRQTDNRVSTCRSSQP